MGFEDLHSNSNQEKPVSSNGEQKAHEYAERVRSGESYEETISGLGPAMKASLDAKLAELESQDVPREENQVEKTESESQNIETHNESDTELGDYIDTLTEGRKQAVRDLYHTLYENRDDPKLKKDLIRALIGDTYRNFRIADYEINPEENQTWHTALESSRVPYREENNWMYRGVFPGASEHTVTRGSFNVSVTPELVEKLDAYISSGKIRANYKFGSPNTPASPQERHDAISIYFLEQPSQEVLDDLATITEPHVRGNNLLGKQVAEGFYLSDIGSIQTEHLETF